MLQRICLVLLLLLLASCSSANVAQPGCLPTGPLTPLHVPSDAALAPYLAQLKADALARWPTRADLPGLAELLTLPVTDRELFSWYTVIEGREDAWPTEPGPLVLALATFPEEDGHETAAVLTGDWFSMDVTQYSSDVTAGTAYHFAALAPHYSRAQLLWLGNQALEKFPTCFLYVEVLDEHTEGQGGAL